LLETYLAKKGIHREIALYTKYFMSVPMIMARSDLAATVPHAIGMYYAKSVGNIKIMVLPMTDVPQIVLRQHWHRRFHKDLRNSIAQAYKRAV
jgi:hypothetical protein